MPKPNADKLTTSQVAILKKMTDGIRLTYSGIYQTYRMVGKSLNKKSIDNLIWLGYLRKGSDLGMDGYYLELTHKGQNIDIKPIQNAKA